MNNKLFSSVIHLEISLAKSKQYGRLKRGMYRLTLQNIPYKLNLKKSLKNPPSYGLLGINVGIDSPLNMPQLSSNLWIVEDKDSLEKHDIQLVRVDGGELVPHPRVGLAVVLRDPGWPALADVLETQGVSIR